uniref:Gag-pol polyprotein n=1 Tax=Solanum tuberosum TaxID=4113 RepID=M1DAV0_SOLTU
MSSVSIHVLRRAKTQVTRIGIRHIVDPIIMPPRRAVRGCPAWRNVEEQELPNAPEVQPQGEVTNVEFREAMRMLSQVVTNQVGQ